MGVKKQFNTSEPALWFRFWAEFLNDPKVQMLSEADQRRYIMVLCLRCGNGDITLQDSEVAFQLRISNEDWTATKATLRAKDLIDEANRPTSWEKRQYASDYSNERVKRHRDKLKQVGNVTVTPPETETETETEKNIPPNPPSGGTVGPAAPVLDIDPWQAGQALCDMLGMGGGPAKSVARDACAAVKRRKPEMRFTEIPEFIQKLWREYDSMAVHALASMPVAHCATWFPGPSSAGRHPYPFDARTSPSGDEGRGQ
jgi:hypothetical protein